MGGFGKPCFWDLVRAHRGGIASNLCQSDGGRAPVLLVQARSKPDLKREFLVQEGTPQSVLVRLRRAVRLVRLQYECQYDCGFLKSVELTVAGRESSVFS